MGTPLPATAPAAVAVVIPPPPPTSAPSGRAARYVSPATASVRIAVNGGAPETFAVGSGTPCPAPPSGPGMCTVYTVIAPLGTDTFTVALLDGAGHVLSQGTAQATIAANVVNSVNISFDGVVASLTIALSNAAPQQGTPANVRVALQPLDAAGFTLVGSPGALPDIAVTDSDTTGTTVLFIGTDASCTTAAATPSTSLTVKQSGSAYPPLCVRYGGGTLANGATITATVAGVPSATATLRPAPGSSQPGAGVWAFGTDSSGATMLDRFDGNLAVVTAIGGTNADFARHTIWGVDSDQNDNAYVLEGPLDFHARTYQIAMFAKTQSGNVAPVAVTQFDIPGTISQAQTGFTLDGAGNAFVLLDTGNHFPYGHAVCRILSVPLTGGTTVPSIVDGPADQTNCMDNVLTTPGLHTDAHGILFRSFREAPVDGQPPASVIFRYRRNADGTVTSDAEVDAADGILDFAFTPAGDIMTVEVRGGLATYPRSLFVTGQTTQTNMGDPTGPFTSPIAIDHQGDVFVRDKTTNGLSVVPAAPGNPVKTVTFVPAALGAAR